MKKQKKTFLQSNLEGKNKRKTNENKNGNEMKLSKRKTWQNFKKLLKVKRAAIIYFVKVQIQDATTTNEESVELGVNHKTA